MKKSLKHRSNVVPMIVAKGVLIDVLLQIFGCNAVMYPANRILDLRPKALNRVCVYIGNHKHTLTMRNLFVNVAILFQLVVDLIFVGVNRCALFNRFFNEWQYGLCLRVGNDCSLNFAVTLQSANNWRFAIRTAPAFTLANTTNVSFVNFNRLSAAAKAATTFIQLATDHLEHAPSRFIGNAQFALQLLCGYAGACLSHKIDRVKPLGQRG
jgi:hypothetical protein